MKLLIFVSVLMLIAQGKAAPSKNEVKEVQSEVVAGYVDVGTGQESGGVPSPALFLEEAPAVDEPAVAGAGPQRAFPFEELAAERDVILPKIFYVPMLSKACTNSACVYICNLLGYANGVCVSTDTCQCF